MTVLDGRSIVDKKYITFPDDLYDQQKQEQPNGVDLRIHRAFQITGQAILPEGSHLDTSNMQINELEPKDGWFEFKPNQGNYLVDFREKVHVPETYCSIIIGRSSLLRVGAFITSALWDAGFSGRCGGMLRVLNPIKIQYAARLGQMVFFKADYNGGLGYSGVYQGGDSQVGFFTEG